MIEDIDEYCDLTMMKKAYKGKTKNSMYSIHKIIFDVIYKKKSIH